MTQLILHATSVSVEGKGVLILGDSGTGKSSLALQMIALGAELVSDDRTVITPDTDMLIATAPNAIHGMIEARGVGLLRCPAAGPTPLALVIDLNRSEPDRLPHPHTHRIAQITLPCLWGVSARHFAASILLYLSEGISGAP